MAQCTSTTATPARSSRLSKYPRCPFVALRFVARKNWFIAGSDDFQLRVFNYNTHEKVAQFEAHPDYIRYLTVHPTASIVLTASDDMTIKAWDWDKGWKCIQVRGSFTRLAVAIEARPLDLRRPHPLYHEPRIQPQG